MSPLLLAGIAASVFAFRDEASWVFIVVGLAVALFALAKPLLISNLETFEKKSAKKRRKLMRKAGPPSDAVIGAAVAVSALLGTVMTALGS